MNKQQEPFQCARGCPCTFFHGSDYNSHVRRFGELKWDHKRYWEEELKWRR